jgi:hypothetical protein
MKINQLAAKPQLVKLTLDGEDVVAEFGETVDIWTWDRQPLDVFMKLARADQNNYGDMVDILKSLILGEDGKPVIHDDVTIPTKVLIAAMTAITNMLGK